MLSSTGNIPLNRLFLLLTIVLMVPALLINLGLMPFFITNDEAIRTLVAFEMQISGDWITPTNNGALYLNKPPLFNWIILAMYNLTGSYSEIIPRLITVASIFLFAFTIYRFNARHLGTRAALIITLAFVTNGRLLFYDSFLGLIDVLHSWVIYLGFMLVYHYYHKKQILLLFVLTYFLTAVAYMLKGLPALIFQAITLLTFFIYNKDFKSLIRWQHFLGIFLLLATVGSYYGIYYFRNAEAISRAFAALLDQSTQRTGLGQSLLTSIRHFVGFPLEFIYHFLPWTLLIIFLFRKGSIQNMMANPFVKFNALIFLFNILLYFFTPGVYGRYFFMLTPLLYTVLVYLCLDDIRQAARWRSKVLEYIFATLMILLAAGLAILPMLSYSSQISNAWLKSYTLLGPCLLLVALYIRQPQHRLVYFAFALLIARIGFDFFVIPERAARMERYREGPVAVATITKGKPLYIYKKSRLCEDASFYISTGRNEILVEKYTGFDTTTYYLVGKNDFTDARFNEIMNFVSSYHDEKIHLAKLKQPEP